MLNRSKLLIEIKRVSSDLFRDITDTISDALSLWRIIANNSELSTLLRPLTKDTTIASWQGTLNHHTMVNTIVTDIHIIGVDGSQIYPNRHTGISCCLINTGIVTLHYSATINGVRFDSFPSIYTIAPENDQFFSEDWVDSKRQELELRIGVDTAIQMQQQLFESNISDSVVLLCDGSLIFFTLDHKDQSFQDHFLTSYIAILEQLYLQNIPIAMYISTPHSKDLVNILKTTIKMTNAKIDNDTLSYIYDSHLIGDTLLPYHRSTIFTSHLPITTLYPDFLKPHFFYLHVGHEIARVEIPAYVAHDEHMVNHVASILLNQSIKGHGYPVALAEAHEQAVIKQPDRDFFYKIVNSAYQKKQNMHGYSLKALHKKRIAI